jgi:anti-sigma-K factor RskA
METDGHQRYEDELAAYMLGSLEPAETEAFEAHLAGCERCRSRERWLQASVEVLPSSVEQVEPPPALRARLMETVRQEAGVSTEAEAVTARRAMPRRRALGGWLGALSLRPAAALTGVLLLLAAGVAGYAIGGDDGGSGTTTIGATGTASAPQTTGTIVRDGDRAVLRVANLPQRRGRVYEVWLVKDGKPVASALFQVHRDGTGAAAIPSGLDGASQVMISSEPASGSDQPTTQPVLTAMI